MSCMRYYTSPLFYTTVLIIVLRLFGSFSSIFAMSHSVLFNHNI